MGRQSATLRAQRFDEDRTMDAASTEHRVALIAGAIAEPARSRMLCALLDGRARTATELASLTELSASTTSTHLARLVEQQLLECMPQGRHRYYALAAPEVGAALESLLVVAGRALKPPASRTPPALRDARTCYDHLAGTLAVQLHDSLLARGWLRRRGRDYELGASGEQPLADWGIDVAALRAKRRRFACACLDWSERRPHVGGALGAAILETAVHRRWLSQDFEGRGVRATPKGRRDWLEPLGITS
jgi:DNA-binding transcriptional ArsR family regulator